MNFLNARAAALALLFVGFGFTGCETNSSRSNLYFHKQALIRYHDSGQYDTDVRRVADRALNFIRRRAASGETNLAVVLDIDDTAISTWERLTKDDFARKDTLFVAWATNNVSAPIEPVRNLYRESRKLGLEIFFITGRRPFLADATERTLKANGYADYDGLFLRPVEDKEKSLAIFKSSVRKKISGQGFKIIANIGDQESDLAGGFAERGFKLPNPFYFTP